eukprot:m.58223 g.58223  ORF g.58223 m.58223 type:complete len:800 (-) comp6880_c0_seq1:40-2439(-)
MGNSQGRRRASIAGGVHIRDEFVEPEAPELATAKAPGQSDQLLGVHFSVLRSLQQGHPNLSIEAMCNTVIKQQTEEGRSSYFEILIARKLPDGRPTLAPATCYVSHAWSGRFDDVVEALSQHEERHPHTYYWIDLLANNQHITYTYKPTWWTTTLPRNINSAHTMALILAPWDDPAPLKRAWCLYELFTAINMGCDLHVLVPARERDSFRGAIENNFESAVLGPLSRIDSANAEASQPSDMEQIFLAVDSNVPGGFSSVNETICRGLRDAYIRLSLSLAEGDSSLRMLYNIANSLQQQGNNRKALELFLKCLEIVERANARTHPIFCSLGIVYENLGEIDKALQFYEKDLAVARQELGEKHPDTGICYNNLGAALRKKGDYDAALDNFEKALAIKLATKGANETSTAVTVRHIGATWYFKGEYDRALMHLKKALGMQQRGERFAPEVAVTCNDIAVAYEKKGDFDRAIEYYEKCLTVLIAVYGEKHADTGACYYNLGLAAKAKGLYDVALQHLDKALVVKLATVGERHSSTAATLQRIGTTKAVSGDFTGALQYFERALPIFLATLGDNHLETAICYNDFGVAYEGKGDYDMALSYYSKSLAIKLAVLGENHIETATCYNNMGIAAKKQGDYDRALEHLDKALRVKRQLHGESNPSTAATLAIIGGVWSLKGDLDKALEHLESALAINLETLGEKSAPTAVSLNDVGFAYERKGELEKALQFYERSLTTKLGVHGENHLETAIAYSNIAAICTKLGDHTRAAKNDRKAYAISLRTLGPDHPLTRRRKELVDRAVAASRK